MAKDIHNAKQVVGCVGASIMLFVIAPIWYVLLGALLLGTEAPTWQWVLFCIYVPAHLLVGLITSLVKELAD